MAVPDLPALGAGNAASNGRTAPDASEHTPLISRPPSPPRQRRIVTGDGDGDDDDDDDDDAVQHYVTPTRAACICFSMWVLMFMQGK